MNKSLIVITGASSGIGEAIAKKFSENGYPLLLIARRIEKLEAMKLPNSIAKKVDVTDHEALRKAIKDAEEVYGETDCIVNNAGVMLLGGVDAQSPKEWTNMFNVNVLALLNGMQSVLASMKERHQGTIINISSIAGRKTFPNHSAYCGTKFAVHAISENVREEVADDNVRVITIAPGAVETELLSHTTSDDPKNHIPLTMKDLIKGFTEGSAATTGFQDTGKLSLEYWADFVVYEQDLYKFSANELDTKTPKVLSTWVGGKRVY